MKTKTINKVLSAKINQWLESIEDEEVRDIARKNTIVTGGAIASMLLNEPVNDFDLYFRTTDAALKVANYYVSAFAKNTGFTMAVTTESDGRIKLTTESGRRGETAGVVPSLSDDESDEGFGEASGAESVERNDDGAPYRPVFLSSNAITLSNKIQIIVRFAGDPDQIHENYDFVHCTNYWTSWDEKTVLRQAALEALLSRELRYVGSKYPVCSVIRLRKFIKRGWTINAGQILKMIMQISELDLTNPAVLEDQLTGVDSAYFIELMSKLRDKDPEKVNSAYLAEIIDRIF
ncbi:hypothetical protein [Ochrobactrum sp. S1502_03]|uniref:hypothetical protein n=1 Tax=Ochrobactrum sp. S1502_03 TaxID=3108451 RepID=UPI0037CAEA68